jgi:hypothetical protein
VTGGRIRGPRPAADAHAPDEEIGVVGKLTIGILLVAALKGLVKLGAMAGAAFLGWKLGRSLLERRTEHPETVAIPIETEATSF